ncbi:Regulatory protein, TetR [Sulfitobacter mediterraneus KCTC 32188]|nr:Regulatory protein, TetR [Sulfitobacter mediterraneus KCTC 32188]
MAGDHMVVHLIGAICIPQGPLLSIHAREWRPLADACRAMHLHRLINDIADLLWHFGLDHRHPDAGLLVAQHIHRLGGLEHQQTHRFNLDLGAGNGFHVLAQIDDLFAKGDAAEAAFDHQIQRLFGLPDRAHAMVNTAWSKAHLADFKTAPFAPKHVFLRHAHIGELDVHMPVRRIVMAKDMHRAQDLNTGVVHRHKDLALLAERFGVGGGFDHHDHDFAARITSAGDVVFLAVDHPFTVFQHRGGRDVLGIRRGDIRLCHRKGRADFTRQQRLEPCVFLLLGADPFQHFHIAGVRRRTIQRLRRQRVLAQLGRDIGVVEIGQAFAGFGIGQEKVPQTAFTGLLLGAFH